MGMIAFQACVQALVRCFDDDNGAAAIEYGLIIAGIALAIVGAVFAVGDDLSTIFNTIASTVSSGNAQTN